MVGTFIAAVALLAAMLYLVVRPFLSAPREVSDADIAHEAIAVPVAAPVSVGAAPVAAEAVTAEVAAPSVVPEQSADTPVAPTSEASADDVRARVEALIAARKAELSAPKCSGCNTAVSPDDAFCRSCGTKLN
jgi:hypothetical protein